MTILVVDTSANGRARYRQVVPLDGVNFVFYFNYNSRDQNWYLSLHDAQDLPIPAALNRKLVANWPPLRLCVDARRPAGQLLVTTVGGADPGLFDLGNGALLMYIPAADLAALDPANA